MQQVRRHERFAAQIPVTVSSVLETHDAVITDVSEGGAKISGVLMPQSTRVWIQHDGRAFYGTVAWTEVDRIGVRFDQPTRHFLDLLRPAAPTTSANILPFGRVRPATFGRKIAA